MGDCQLSVVPRLHLEYSHYFRMETISVLLPTNDAGSARQKLPRLRRMRDFDFPILLVPVSWEHAFRSKSDVQSGPSQSLGDG